MFHYPQSSLLLVIPSSTTLKDATLHLLAIGASFSIRATLLPASLAFLYSISYVECMLGFGALLPLLGSARAALAEACQPNANEAAEATRDAEAREAASARFFWLDIF